MGAGASALSPVNPGFSTMCVCFQSTDRIIVLHLDDPGLSTIRQAINESWAPGIQSEENRCGSGWSFKLNGNPFSGGFSFADYSLPCRKMVCHVLERLYSIGWKIAGSASLGRAQTARSTLFFQRSFPEFSVRPFVCVGLKGTDKLQFVNLPCELLQPIKEVISSSWSLGIQQEKSEHGMLVIKLHGTPWCAGNRQSIMGKLLLQNIIAAFRRHQWGYYCNIDLNRTVHSLFFCHDPTITRGESLPYCTISLKRRDRLRVINAPQEVVSTIRKVLATTWSLGRIHHERHYFGSWEFKLSGYPWYTSGREESTMSRYLVTKILEAMQESGWHNVAGVNCSQRVTDKAVMIFSKQEPKHSPMMCVSLNEIDKCRLINMPPELGQLYKDILLSRLPQGIQAEKQLTLSFGNVCELKLSGRPWSGGGRNDSLHARSILCHILEKFKEKGWKLLLSADIASKFYDEDGNGNYVCVDVNSMWFVYEPSLPGPSSVQPPDFNFSLMPAQYGPSAPPLQYPAVAGSQFSGSGMQLNVYPPFNEPPPPYMEFQASGM